MGASPTYSGTTAISDTIAQAFSFTVPAGSNYTLTSFSAAGHYTGAGDVSVTAALCTGWQSAPPIGPTGCSVIQSSINTSSYTTVGTKVTWTGTTPALTCGATYWITLGGNTGGGFVVDGANPASTAGTGAAIAGEANKSAGTWATPTTTPAHSWEVIATPTTTTGCTATPVSASVVNLNDKAETFASELK